MGDYNAFLVVGLRAIHPTILGEHVPGYLMVATSTHRMAFQFPGHSEYWAWCSNPNLAHKFHSEKAATAIIERLIAVDPGYFRPLTILRIYF